MGKMEKYAFGDIPSYYDVLQVCPDADDAEVKRAYHRMARRFHPDCNPGRSRQAELQFRLINEAYQTLRTARGRARYTRMLKRRVRVCQKKAHNDNMGPASNNAHGRGDRRRLLENLKEIFWPIHEDGQSL